VRGCRNSGWTGNKNIRAKTGMLSPNERVEGNRNKEGVFINKLRVAEYAAQQVEAYVRRDEQSHK
jgi:hypothetical protein